MSSALRSAAQTVALEESLEMKGLIIMAAEEVAQNYGLDSPTKKRIANYKSKDWFNDENEYPAKGNSVRFNDNEGRHESESNNKMMDDVSALASQMGVTLNPEANSKNDATSIHDDVQKLANEMGVTLTTEATDDELVDRLMAPQTDSDFNENIKLNRNNKALGKQLSNTANERDLLRYQNARKQIDSKQKLQGINNKGDQVVIITRRSKVSKLLEKDTKDVIRTNLSQTQEMLFREMRVIEAKEDDSKKKKHRKIIIKGGEEGKSDDVYNRLSTQGLEAHKKTNLYDALVHAASKKPNIDDREKKFSLFDDAKECTFHPKVKKNAYTETRNDDDGPKKSNFIERQEASERSRVDRLDVDKRKSDYEAVLDKKYCPKCGAKQSYDDIKEKRRKCNNCHIEYKTKIAWNNVKNNFYKRQQDTLVNIEKKVEKISLQVEQQEKRGLRERVKNGTIVYEEVDYSGNDAKWDDEMEYDFFERSKLMAHKKALHLKKIEDEMYNFDRDLNYLKSTGDLDDGEYYDYGTGSRLFGIDAVTDFLQRYEDDVKRRNAIKAMQRQQEKERSQLISQSTFDNSYGHDKVFKL
jgi:hypothetical protein